MTRAPELTAVNCTSCGAGLDVLGGGRVRVHVCPYCGAELDAQDAYRVLRRYTDMPRPDSPFRVGMAGDLFGVSWTVIGTIGKREGPWAWAEHQLYSPTHGYAWLTVEDGHMTFSRRMRRPAHPAFMGVRWVESAEQPPRVRLDGDSYRYYETSEARITFLEGEFTWAPELGARGTTVSAMSDDAMLDFSVTGAEREVYRTVYLDAGATARAFGLTDVAPPRGRHPLMPFRTGRHDGFLLRVSGAFAALCLVALVGLWVVGTARTVHGEEVVPLTDLPRSVPFEVTQTDKLVSIGLYGNPYNAWGYLELEVVDPEEDTLFETGRTMEFYTGRDSDGTWTEGNRGTTIRFRPTVPGTYQVVFHDLETELWQASGQPISQVRLSVREGVTTTRWLLGLAAVFGLVAAFPLLRRGLHDKRRWAGSDWTEE